MLDRQITLGSTSNILRAKLRKADTGQGLTGLTYSTSGLIISTICDNEATAVTYTVAGSTIEDITTLGTFAAPTATKCRFKAVDATNHPGTCEIQIADARFAVSGAKFMRVSILGAANLLEKELLIELTKMDMYDSVRGGMTALPNAAAEAAGGLYTRGTGAGQINQEANGRVDGNVAAWLGTAAHAATVAGVPIVQQHTTAGGIDGPVAYPTYFEHLSITDTTGLVAVPTTQKVDVETIKTRAVTCGAGVTVLASVGTAATSTTQTADVATLITTVGTAGAGLTAVASATNLATVDTVVDAVKLQTDKLAFTVANKVDSNVYTWNGTAVATPATAGVPSVDAIKVAGADPDSDTTIAAAVAAQADIAAGLAALVELLTRVPDVAITTGTVATSGGANTASAFYTDLAGADDFWNDCLILITNGALAGQVKKIGNFADTNGVVTLAAGEAFTGVPADGVTFTIINR